MEGFQQFSKENNEDFCQKMHVHPESQGKILYSSSNFFLKTEGKFCQNSSKIVKNSIYWKL